MTIPSTVSAAPHGTPYPDSRLTGEERLARYVHALEADARRQRAYRAGKVAMKLIQLNEGFGA